MRSVDKRVQTVEDVPANDSIRLERYFPRLNGDVQHGVWQLDVGEKLVVLRWKFFSGVLLLEKSRKAFCTRPECSRHLSRKKVGGVRWIG